MATARAATLALAVGGVLLATSLFLPFWEMQWTTPSRPDALRVVGYLHHVDGPIESLPEPGAPSILRTPPASLLRRAATLSVLGALCLLVGAAAFVRNRWAAALSLPSLLFPLLALADVARWQRPIVAGILTAAGIADPDPPRLLFGLVSAGDSTFLTRPCAGLLLYAVAALVVIVGLWLHRRAYDSSRSAALRRHS